ncbi:CBS domain-containing protein [Streptomyces nigra]|jgi:CBS domain-containing protein|uniref:CBS domain-containing protein n=1 Tax=Streptomyces TaxID=1883 RepID=UPI000E1DA44A|nr:MULTISPECIES: CBS domain-containing protein [unclassified Streptomyces]MCF2536115.1 CBS domain-containing protein [Streptomyces sp. FB2]RDS65967.1 CBS domain-containing protein [Streptomyces sp. M7]
MPESPYTVSDVMTHTVVAVGSEAPFKEIVELLDQWKVSALPVLAGEGRVVGVVSEADLLPKEEVRDGGRAVNDLRTRLKASALTAGEVMSTPAVTVHADASLAEAARVMARRHVKRLPVVDGVGMLQGVVSRSDLLKVFLRSDTEIGAEIRDHVLTHLPVTDGLEVSVTDGVVTLSGSMPERGLVPVVARAVTAVEGVVDVQLDLTHR